MAEGPSYTRVQGVEEKSGRAGSSVDEAVQLAVSLPPAA